MKRWYDEHMGGNSGGGFNQEVRHGVRDVIVTYMCEHTAITCFFPNARLGYEHELLPNR